MILPKPLHAEKRAPQVLRRKRGPNRKRKTSRGAQGRLADKLFSLIVRRGGAAECWYHVSTPCTGPLQCAHICSRRYRSVRWDEYNAMPLCAAAHMKFTHDPIAWDDFAEKCGVNLKCLKLKAQERWDGDLEGVLVRLAARAVALGIEPE